MSMIDRVTPLRTFICVLLAAGLAVGAGNVGLHASDADDRFATRVVAHAPDPWFVEGVTIIGDRVFVGSAWGLPNQVIPTHSFGQPSRIFVYDLASWELLDTILVEGEDTTREHGLAGLKTDGSGNLYAASGQLGVLRFVETGDDWRQELYAAIPDLPTCTLDAHPCSPTPEDRPGLPNDMTWDADGNLYVSDSFQATIWKIPPGPTVADRTPQIWYQHPDLHRLFGPNGLRITPEGDRMYLAVCCPDTFQVGPVDRAARIVSIPFPVAGSDAPTDIHVFDNGEGADGIEFNDAGELYVLSNIGTKIFVLGPDGDVKRTITNDDLVGEAVLDGPASITFNAGSRSVLITNYAYLEVVAFEESKRYLLEVFVDDTSTVEQQPVVP